MLPTSYQPNSQISSPNFGLWITIDALIDPGNKIDGAKIKLCSPGGCANSSTQQIGKVKMNFWLTHSWLVKSTVCVTVTAAVKFFFFFPVRLSWSESQTGWKSVKTCQSRGWHMLYPKCWEIGKFTKQCNIMTLPRGRQGWIFTVFSSPFFISINVSEREILFLPRRSFVMLRFHQPWRMPTILSCASLMDVFLSTSETTFWSFN